MAPSSSRDGSPPAEPSTLACPVCGQHALAEGTPGEFADGPTRRLVCHVCGAHQVTS